ncbi:MAG: alkaline phosphatase family protein [Acidobacteriota bacterium]
MPKNETGVSPQTFACSSTSNRCVRNWIRRAQGYLSIALSLAILAAIAALQLACGGYSAGSASNPIPTSAPTTFPTFSHVFVVVEENHSFTDVIGNSSMPYLNSLASKYGLAKQYFANAHPSIPNYLMLTTGQMETLNDNFSGTIGDENVVRELVSAGKTWKTYQESIPAAGYLGGDASPYVRRHNPFSLLSDVQNNPAQAANIVPFTQFAPDLANNLLPNFSFIVPDVNNDAHDGTLATADSWLQSNMAPLIASSTFQSGGLLVILFDEGELSDFNHGGGQVAVVIVSSNSKPNFQSQTLYQHQSTLRLVLEALGVKKFPGQAATAPDMAEFFSGH